MVYNLYTYICCYTGIALSYVVPSVTKKVIDSSIDKIYTGYIRRRFSSFGHSVIKWKPLVLAGERYITIGEGTVIDKNLQLTAWKTGQTTPHITIGDNCLIRSNAHITAASRITIGNNLLTGTNVLITDNSHGNTDAYSLQIPPIDRPIISKGPVTIGNNVWLGNNVCVMPGVTIGDGAIVGANSLVTHDIPSFTVAAGVPAKVIGHNDK